MAWKSGTCWRSTGSSHRFGIRRLDQPEQTVMFPNFDQTTVYTPSRYLNVPDERTGILMVFRVFDRVSYALVLNSTDAVRTGDFVRTP